MEIDMETSPSYFNPEDLTIREPYRRYGKRHSTSGRSPHQEQSFPRSGGTKIFSDGKSVRRHPNAALFLEDIKLEAQSVDSDSLDGASGISSRLKRKSATNVHGTYDGENVTESFRQSAKHSLNSYKQEDDTLVEGKDTTLNLFASLLDSALKGSMPIPDLILQFEETCRDLSETIRYGANERHRIMEEKLTRQKSQQLLDEAASWSLLWFLYGKENEELPEDLILSPTTSHLEACQYVVADHTTQLCLRIVMWLEGLASKSLELDKKVRGSHVGTYPSSSGVWHHTQRYLKKGVPQPNTIHHLDFDAPTRECAEQLPDDKKQDESLLEDVWVLLRAGRLEEACELCRSAGQPWRAATLCPFGGLDMFPSVESLVKNGKNRALQATELESGIGHQWRLWKWASYCASEAIAEQNGSKYETAVYAAQCSNLKRILPICTDWESACWTMAKSWLDIQVDMHITRLQPGGVDLCKRFEDGIDQSPGKMNESSPLGHENWPLQVLTQQPRHLSSLLQKLHSSDLVHEAVIRGCKERHRKIEMNLMMGDIPSLLDLIWSLISPSDDDANTFKVHGDVHLIRFGAHLVLVLRYLLEDQMKDAFQRKIETVGDLILNMYAMYLFSKQHEDLVGIYASHLARHRCIDLFVHMMELRLNSSVHTKYKIFLSAMEYLPFSPEDDSKGSFEEIIERVLSRSREVKPGKYDNSGDVAEQHRLQSVQKAMVIQWLCFTPPSTVTESEMISAKLLLQALLHSNILFREFALISMWRVPAMPTGAHKLLSFLAEPLKQAMERLCAMEDIDVSENLREFQDWSEYYSCDATYRNWLGIELENVEVPPSELSVEEKQRTMMAAKETLDSSLLLLLREDNPWLVPIEDRLYDSSEPLFLELHATAILCYPSGERLCPDATVCATLMSALYSSVTEEEVLSRQLMVNATISTRDSYCIEVVLRCKAIDGDGHGLHELNDGGLLANVLAAGFKGELVRFQAGVTMEISRLDAWYSSKEAFLDGPATYILRGLCRRCCIPELILRCMQVSVSLMESGYASETHDQLIELVADSETGYLHLFSPQQLQEFLMFEREYTIYKMEVEEEELAS
ncbi:nuclear pore complex protein NUP107 [Impatiens glandulifera]|uniref:nuclear pore complex protein NUP107 n=1 Tax=Impatiens glandulifera TaxID=253017 RepID=UPI001FB0762B|nr:nuclear pore complex protein NUP107 [Impatiens glandulifera]